MDKRQAVVDGDTFDALLGIARKHGCEAGAVLGVSIAGRLDKWAPDFRKSMIHIFGKGAGAALDALHLEGWVVNDQVSGGGGGAKGDDQGFITPVDILARAWTAGGGGSVSGLAKRRIHSHTAGKYPDGPAKLCDEGVRIYLKLFPQGSFESFVGDAFRHSSSMDMASVAARGGDVNESTIVKWRNIWQIAGQAQPSSKIAGDPYLFLCCALNPKFDEALFRKNLALYNIWDAVVLSGSKGRKKPPDPAALTGIKGGGA